MSQFITPRQAQGILARCRQDPAFFCQDVLGDNLWEKQVEILESVRDNKRTAVRSCHGAGKSFTSARAILWYLYCFPGSIVATTAPTFRQVQKIIWQEIRRAHGKSRFPLGGSLLQTELKISDGWFAFGFSTDDPDAFQGLHSPTGRVLCVLDEASGIDRAIWESVEGILTSEDCRLLSIGNPTDPTSAFADEFRVPGTSRIAISAFDTPNLTNEVKQYPGLVDRDWVEDKRRRWGEASPMWQARVLGAFPDVSNDTLFPLSWIERAMGDGRNPPKNERRLDGPIELGADIARFGDDETNIMLRRGNSYKLLKTTTKQDTMQTTGQLVALQRIHKATSIKVDDIGVGGGVTDRLDELGMPVIGVNVGEAARDKDQFLNKRAEYYWHLREQFDHHDIVLEYDEEMLSQLATIKYKFTSSGKIQVESKADMKKRGLHSPDRADALMLAAAPAEGIIPSFTADVEDMTSPSLWVGPG